MVLFWKFLGFGCATALLAAASFPSLVEGSTRSALRDVVRMCVANYSLTGNAFPCLSVALEGNAAKGWVVLRPPVGPPDTILVPTLSIVGAEDPWLQNPEATNYFAAAWNARRALEDDDGVPLTAGDGAVAVNSRFARTQDQLHLHIGCLAPSVRGHLQQVAARLTAGAWTRVDRVLPGGREIWLLRTGSTDAAAVQPFQRVAEIAADGQKMERMLIALATAPVEDRNEFFVIAARTIPGVGPNAEDMVRPRCARLAQAQ